MNDMLGELLEIGDIIAYPTPHNRGISIGKIESFTAKRVRVTQYKPYTSNGIVIPSESLKLDKSNPVYIEMVLLK